MTVLNFPASPSNGDTYEENGVVYTWNGSYWSANNASDLGNIYVAIAGDRMTGNLELPGGGGDTAALQRQEIQLLIDAGGGGGGTDPTDLYWERDAGALSPKVSTDNIDIGDGKITLAADGSASFVNGTAQVNSDGNIALSVDGTGWDSTKNSGAILISRYGVIGINNQNNASPGSYVFSAQQHDGAGNVTLTSAITVDGSSQFASDIQSTSQNGSQLAGFRNQIINGDFRIWQRGLTFTNVPNQLYTADRWVTGRANLSATRSDDVPSYKGISYSLAITGANATTRTSIELDRPGTKAQFTLEKYTLSFYTKQAVADLLVDVRWANLVNGADEVVIVTSAVMTEIEPADSNGWRRLSLNIDFAGAAAPNPNNKCAYFVVRTTGSTLNLTGCQLEPGPVATVFEHRPIATELALCQRYYEVGRTKSYIGGISSPGGIAIATNYKVNKRTEATVIYGNSSGFDYPPDSTEWNYVEGFSSVRTNANELAFIWTADAEL